VRDAATVIVLRDAAHAPKILMGQRGQGAAFMPSKFVFPGGAVDPADGDIPFLRPPPATTAQALARDSARTPTALIAAAIRELWEETGLVLGTPGAHARSADAPRGWRGYLAHGVLPDGAAVEFVFRAVTPPGRSRRFDARFLLADAAALASDPDDFSRAGDELRHLQWVPLEAARGFDMPFITEVALAEVRARLAGAARPGVPFFDNRAEEGRFSRL